MKRRRNEELHRHVSDQTSSDLSVFRSFFLLRLSDSFLSEAERKKENTEKPGKTQNAKRRKFKPNFRSPSFCSSLFLPFPFFPPFFPLFFPFFESRIILFYSALSCCDFLFVLFSPVSHLSFLVLFHAEICLLWIDRCFIDLFTALIN
jgi:hypothetical protein